MSKHACGLWGTARSSTWPPHNEGGERVVELEELKWESHVPALVGPCGLVKIRSVKCQYRTDFYWEQDGKTLKDLSRSEMI